MKKILSLGIITLLLGANLGTPFAQAETTQGALDPQSAAMLKQTLDTLGTVIAQLELEVNRGALDAATASNILNGLRASLAGINSALAARTVAMTPATPPTTAMAESASMMQSEKSEMAGQLAPAITSGEDAVEASALLSADATEETAVTSEEINELATTASGTDFRKLGWLLPIIIVLGAVLFLRRRGGEEELVVAKIPSSEKNAVSGSSAGYPEAY